MTETNLEAMQRKIAGLLRKAEGASTTAEAGAFASKAEQLMVKYSIDAAMLATEEKEAIITRHVDIKGIYALPTTIGLNGLAKALGTTQYWIMGRQSKSHTGVICGFQGDVDTLVMLWSSLTLQATTAMQQWAAQNDRLKEMTPFEKFNERRTFLMGFWVRASKRAEDAFKVAVKEADAEYSGGAALALVDRAAQVKAHMPANMKTQKSRTKTGSWDASKAGAAAADKADLGQKRMANRKSLPQ